MRDNDMKTIKVCVDRNMLYPGKKWGYMHGSLGGSVSRQAARQNFSLFDNFDMVTSKA